MVEAPSLSAAETAQIIDIVQRKTEIAAENIIITVSGAE
jgi:stage III sporulation protein AH